MMYIMYMRRPSPGTARRFAKGAAHVHATGATKPDATATGDRNVVVDRAERVLSTAEARTHLSETLGRVAYAGERVVIGKRGKPMAALVPIADLLALRALEDAIDLEAARKSRRQGGASISHAEVGKRLGVR